METLATMIVPAMLAHFNSGDLVGHLVVPSTMPIQRQTYEVAAWYRDYQLDPGTYEVHIHRNEVRSLGDFLFCEVPGTVVKAYLASLLGGVAVNGNEPGERAVGERGTYRLSAWLGFDHEATVRRIDFGNGCIFIPLEG